MKKWQYYLTLLVLLLSSVLSPVSAWAQEVAAPQETSALVGDSQAQPEAEATEESEEGLDSNLPSDVDLDELIRQAPNVKAVPNVVTRIYATTRDGKPITKNLLKWEAFRINVDFTLPNNVIKAGDTTVIEVPSTLAFTEVSNFEVRDSSGQHVVATATIQPGARTVTLTYTSYAQNNSDITGNLFFYARINHAEVTEKGNVDLNFVVENKQIPGGSVPFEGAPIPKGNPMDKSGWQLPGQPNKIRYIVAVNRRGEQRKHVVIRDYLKDEGLAIDQSSVSITKGHWVYQNGGWVLQNGANAAGSYNITWDQGNTGFTIDFGDLDTQTGFEILYTVNIPYDAADGEKFGNYAAMNDANGTVAYTNYDYSYSIAGGNAEGYTFVVKVHKHDGQGKDLAGAEFEVVRDANKKVVGKIVTDAQGNGQVAGLLRDAYTLREIKAPDGYQLSNEEIKIQGGDFGADKSVLKQVVNVPAVTTVDVRGTKTWSDAENQDGLRPEQVTIKLLANGTETGQTTTATAANGWTYEFTGLDAKDAQGQAITYSVAEEAVAGYTSTLNGYNLTNSHTPETVSIQGTKTWEDGDNQDGLRPEQITVKLLADGVETGQTTTATAANNWTYEFSNLPKNKAGQAITYSVAEEAVQGYTSTVKGYDISNSHTPETVSVQGSKTWEDGDNQDGLRPEQITVKLLANGVETGQTTTATAANNWTYEFSNLPKNKAGQAITYSVAEEAVAGYTTKVNGYNLTNSHTPETVSIQGTKTWEDGDNQDGLRPEQITVKLLADGVETGQTTTATAANNWTYEFSNLPKNKAGKAISYSVAEEAVAGYNTTVNGYDLTNNHATDLTSVSGTKTWQDNDDQDGLRPGQVTIKLLADGVETGQTAVASAANNWTYEFSNLPKNKAGKAISYSVAEEAVAGYTASVNGYNLTNSHTPETVSVQGTKTWQDNDNQDGVRPEQVTIKLLADGVETGQTAVANAANNWTYEFSNLPKNKAGKAITYSVQEEAVAEYTASYQAYNVTNSHTPGQTSHTVQKVWDDGQNQDGLRPVELKVQLYADDQKYGDEVSLTAANNWTYTWSQLPEKAQGKAISYQAREVAVPEGYQADQPTTQATVTTLTNRHTPEVTSVSGAKTWKDNNNQDGVRPERIKVNLLADGVLKASKEVSAADNWSYSFDNLPKFAAGQAVVYTITEDAVAEYSTQVEGYNLTNSHTPGQTSLTVTKQWQDQGDQDGLRPSQIQVQLYADGVASGSPVTLTAANNWVYTWSGLAEKANGKTIEYSVKEVDQPSGYTSTISQVSPGNVLIVNQHTPATTEVKGQKTWDDANNQDGKRPEAVTVQLYADGQVVASQVVTAANNWTYSFSNLPQFAKGKAISYSVQELVDAGLDKAGYRPSYEAYNITNHYKPEVTTFEVRKVWNDQNDQDKLRPSQIQVQLYADGKAFGEPVTLKADNDWRHVFADLAKYQEGKEVVYTVEEVAVPSGYSVTSSQTGVNQVTLTNTHQPKRPEDPGKKDLPKTGSAETFSLALAGLMAMTGLGILWGTKRRQA
ncbi:Cna B-type domain-containing protein [Abiotrophia defectiva]|uniref:Cna B-type domain-containing protein n=1 Tax=Abiotrophia defectiva TaxID=46125 RepID=UPI0028D746F0|nr:Cna B-type domain-containing protein [Abiotrophia defectiva]